MVTMLDCIRRVPSLLDAIVSRDDAQFQAVWETYDARQIDELYLIGSGTSYTSAYTARFLAEAASGVRVTVALPNEFLHGFSVRNRRALYVFVTQTGTSGALIDALTYAMQNGLMTTVVSEKADTPAARQSGVFIDMGCGHEEYGMRTIGYSTSVMTLMRLGIALGRARGTLSEAQADAYTRQARDASRNIPDVIQKALHWMDTSRRRIMRSRFIAFTGTAALYGVAKEGALKLWEAPQYPSAAYELDEGTHGPNFGYTSNEAVIVLNDGTPGSEKGSALARYMKNELHNGYIFGLGAIDENDLSFVPAGGPFACLEFAAAVQVFMYRLAIDGGRDFSILDPHAIMNSYFKSHKG